MRYLKVVIFSISVLLLGFIGDPIDPICSALKAGDSHALSGYFGKTVDLTLLDREDAYSASQTELMLKDFFAKNPVKAFQVLHKGNNDGAAFVIGTMTTTNNRKLRVSFHLQQSKGIYLLQELSIQPE